MGAPAVGRLLRAGLRLHGSGPPPAGRPRGRAQAARSGRRDERRAESSRLTLASRVELLLAEGRFEEALAAADDLAERCGAVVNPGWAPWRSLKARALHGLGRPTRRSRWRARSSCMRAASARRASWAARCECSGRSSASGASTTCTRPSSCSSARRPSSSWHSRSSRSARRCGAGGSRPRPASRSGARSSWPTAAAPSRSPSRHARSSTQPAADRAGRRSTGVESLTASERRVAELAAEGRTNKQIAQALYVTLKTVELHLSNAYRKLGIRSRRELGRRP